MNLRRREYSTDLFRLVSPLFLYLVSFRRKIRKGFNIPAETAKQEIDRLFGEIERNARQDPRLEMLYGKAKYPLVVLTDEILLQPQTGWPGRDAWELLEERQFGLNVGGDKVFEDAEKLQYDDVELATILYTTICLGVTGKYHEDLAKLEEVKTKLYRILGENLADIQQRLTPDAYHAQPKEAVKLSPAVTLGRVLIVAGGIVVLYWAAAAFWWGLAVGDLREIIQGISS